MWRVQTASRLHFGLINLTDAPEERRFGGVGLMVEPPGLAIRAEEAADWAAEGPLATRALSVMRRFAATLDAGDLPPRRLVIETAPPEHAGLGSGTQLALATAAVLAASWGRAFAPEELAERTGRGQRSALGTHGFARGGFLVEAGKRPGQAVSPLVARADFPDDWRVLIVLPGDAVGLHGSAERAAFGTLATPPATRDALCRIALLGLLPALLDRDLGAFGEAVHDFNALAGEVFAPAQGGTWSSPQVADLIAFFRRSGVRGAGQSSWGPGVFAFLPDDESARHHAARAGALLAGNGRVVIARGRNRGADVG